MTATTIVVPTMGRPSLHALLEALARQTRTVDAPVVLVDDRPDPAAVPIDVATYPLDVTVVRTGGGGPARARNIGWRHARTPWVSFVDDDVLPDDDWYELLLADLE
jgi:glycosyltransferase involved in cell wall biosynthesis